MSIAKSQQQLLETAFLDQLGSSDWGTMEHSGLALIEAAGFLIGRAQDNLDKKGAVATGELSSSIASKEVNLSGSTMTIPIVMLFYWKFINDGVKGVDGGKGKYQFKTRYPSKKMALAILKWARRRGMRAKERELYRYKISKTKVEKKDEGLRKRVKKADGFKQMAYAIATNIKKFGIKKTDFLTDAVKDTLTEFKPLLSRGFKADIIKNIKDEFESFNLPK